MVNSLFKKYTNNSLVIKLGFSKGAKINIAFMGMFTHTGQLAKSTAISVWIGKMVFCPKIRLVFEKHTIRRTANGRASLRYAKEVLPINPIEHAAAGTVQYV